MWRRTYLPFRRTHGQARGFESLEQRYLLAGAPLISEFMAVNDRTLADQDGDFSDWIELYNASDETAKLQGWSLTDDAREPTKWRFPDVSIEPRGYLLVFASGKNRVEPTGELHANFRLSGDGEYLALVEPNGVTVRQQFAPEYPAQSADLTYGLGADLATRLFFTVPTPGAANAAGWIGLAAAPTSSVQRGLFSSAFDVVLTSPTPDAEIRYTLDGSPPGADTGNVYDGPIHVASTTMLRAASFKPDYLPSPITTQSYLFPEDVLTQTKPEGYPDLEAGDYNTLPAVVQFHRDTILDDLRAVPTMSLVMPVDDMFGPQGTNTTGEDHATSVEMIFADGRTGFQIDAGIRQQGGATRATNVPKHAFRLRFTSEYGPSKLEFPLFSDSSVTSFDTVILRAGLQDGWQRGAAGQDQYVKDEFARRTQLAMSQPSAHGTWVQLYINGLYWGLYNLVERPDASFASAHLGGDKDDWDALNAGRVRDGNTDAWDAMLALTPRGIPDLPSFDAARVQANYQAIQQYLDIPGFIDYVLVGTYIATQDWLPNNYYAARRSRDGGAAVSADDPTGKFRFFHWDQESSLQGLDEFKNLPGFASPVGRIFQLLRLSPEFRELNAQRIYDQLFHGALSPEAAAARYQGLVDEVKDAIKGEAIRWGGGPNNVPDWQAEAESLVNSYFPNRREGILEQYRRFNLYPNTDAPVFSRQGGRIRPDELLTMSVGEGQIYYTLDGSDPKLPDGTISPAALLYSQPIALSSDATVRARTRAQDEWSVMNHADFTLDTATRPGDFDRNQVIDAADIDLLCQQILSTTPDALFDLNGDQRVDRQDHEQLIERILQTQFGDANLDRVFDPADLTAVFQANLYEQDTLAGWATGDWNCDGRFTSADLVLAFQSGGLK